MSAPTPPTADAVPATLYELMAQALQMELEAVQRYNEFADMMETHNNPEVGQWFRKMAEVEGKHASQILDSMGWSAQPAYFVQAPMFDGFEAPENAALDQVHYLMKPWHVLQMALANEERAERFFDRLAGLAELDAVREAALALRDEEREHVELVKSWMLKVPQPDSNWDQDPDPPRYDG